ncbi:MAG TPA: NIL domain-containing protein [Thermodesulfobacteriota bacterium]|nr:NIL domain-containing protein [Thermodesulfobacteriota bacterium]
MLKRKLLLTFPNNLIDKPITYHLVKDYDLELNILRAHITPKEEGRLIVELNGKREKLRRGEEYLKSLGVRVEPLALDIAFYEDRCTQCTACSGVCRSGAISVDRKKMKIIFEKDKCIACELCVMVCPFRAVEIKF